MRWILFEQFIDNVATLLGTTQTMAAALMSLVIIITVMVIMFIAVRKINFQMSATVSYLMLVMFTMIGWIGVFILMGYTLVIIAMIAREWAKVGD